MLQVYRVRHAQQQTGPQKDELGPPPQTNRRELRGARQPSAQLTARRPLLAADKWGAPTSRWQGREDGGHGGRSGAANAHLEGRVALADGVEDLGDFGLTRHVLLDLAPALLRFILVPVHVASTAGAQVHQKQSKNKGVGDWGGGWGVSAPAGPRGVFARFLGPLPPARHIGTAHRRPSARTF